MNTYIQKWDALVQAARTRHMSTFRLGEIGRGILACEDELQRLQAVVADRDAQINSLLAVMINTNKELDEVYETLSEANTTIAAYELRDKREATEVKRLRAGVENIASTLSDEDQHSQAIAALLREIVSA